MFKDLKKDEHTLLSAAVAAEVDRLAGEYSFFHWHLEFPGIFRVGGGVAGIDKDTGWAGGFTVLLGNPPWDKVDFEDKKYFSVVEPTIAALAGQKRRDRIKAWEKEHPEEGDRYRTARQRVKSTFLFVSSSEAYPNCAKGLKEPGVNSLQTDMLFAELFATLAASAGRVGCIIPTAIATGAGGQHVFRSFAARGGVASLYDFDNRKPLFPAVDSRYKFCVLSLTGKSVRESAARYAFFLNDVNDLDDPNRTFALSPEELTLINPNTGTLPIFRNRKIAALTTEIYGRVPVFWNETKRDGNKWQIRFKNLFNMTDDSDVFRNREQVEREGWRLDGNVFTRDGTHMLPLYESKMAHHFDHRWNSFYGTDNDEIRHLSPVEKQDPEALPEPRYWVREDGLIPSRRNGKDAKVPGVSERLAELHWERAWLCGWRDVCRATDERTAIPAFIPRAAAGHTFPLMLPSVSPALVASLIAAQSSLIFDFVARQKVGGIHMNLFIWKQLPTPAPAMVEPHLDFIVPRALELVYTAYDMTPLARDLGDEGEPFRWDEKRRARLRAELDAFFFRLYGIDDRADVDYILETFQTETGGLKHNEIKEHGFYRTKEWVLEEYDRMAAAETSGVPYESTLKQKPGDGPRHPAR